MKNLKNLIVLMARCGKRFIKQTFCSHRYRYLCKFSHHDSLAKKDSVELCEYACVKCDKHLIVRMDEVAQGASHLDW